MVIKHVHEPPIPSGIDYLAMLEKQHAQEIKELINYSKFSENNESKNNESEKKQ